MPRHGEWSWAHIENILNSEGHEWPATGPNIQEAIDDLPVAGGWVWLPEGAFMPAVTIVPCDNLKLIGKGRSTIIQAPDGFDDDLIKATGKTGVVIKQIQFIGNEANQTAESNGAKLHGCAESEVSECWFTDIRDLNVAIHGCTDTIIENNHFSDVRMRSVDLDTDGIVQCERIVIAHNTIVMKTADLGVGAAGIKVEEATQVTVAENVLKGSGVGSTEGDYGIIVSTKAVPVIGVTQYVTVLGNAISDFDSSGIRIVNTENIGISENTITTCLYGIALVDASHYCTLAGNSIEGCTSRGIFISASDYTAVAGNTCENCIRGINLTDADYTCITGDVCTNCTTGVQEAGTSDFTLLDGCMLAGNTAAHDVDAANSVVGDIIPP